jgi:hypothetical protein
MTEVASLSKEIQQLELKIKNRVENNAENHKYGKDLNLDTLQNELVKLMAKMSAILPQLSTAERQNVLEHVSAADSTQLLDDQAVKALGLSRSILKLQRRQRSHVEDIVHRSNNLSEQNGFSSSSLTSSSEDDSSEADSSQAKIDKMMLELSSLLPMLDETTKSVVFDNIQAAYE